MYLGLIGVIHAILQTMKGHNQKVQMTDFHPTASHTDPTRSFPTSSIKLRQIPMHITPETHPPHSGLIETLPGWLGAAGRVRHGHSEVVTIKIHLFFSHHSRHHQNTFLSPFQLRKNGTETVALACTKGDVYLLDTK